MDKSNTYDLGKEAGKLSANKAFNAAILNIKNRYFEKFCNLSVGDIDEMNKVNLSMSAIDELEEELKDLIIDGNNAEKSLKK